MRNLRKPDVFVDMCTQRDYLAADGACPIPNAPQTIGNLKQLMAVARLVKIPTLSCVDARRPQEVRGLPNPSCVIGTPGQLKPFWCSMPRQVFIDSDNCLCVSLDILNEYQQVVLTKSHRDPFTNPKFDRLLTELPARRFVVFGVSLECSIRLVTLGLLLRHRHVAVVYDACGWWDAEEGEMTLRQLSAKGCEMITTSQLLETTIAQYRPRRNGRRRSVA